MIVNRHREGLLRVVLPNATQVQLTLDLGGLAVAGGLFAAASWGAAAVITKALPDVVPSGSDDLFAIIVGLCAVALASLALAAPRGDAAGPFPQGT